jgi:hypothetical protein
MAEGKLKLPEGVPDRRSFQKTVWRVQRVAWVGFAFLLIFCLLGLFGRGGLLARGELRLAAGSIDYPKISRWNAPDEIRVMFRPSPNEQTLVVDSRFLEAFSVEGIDPPAKSASVGDGVISYVFPGDPMHPSAVIFRLEAQSPGLHPVSLGIGDEVGEHSVFVFP